MKKIIALLLFTTFGYSQTYTPVRSTLHDNIKLKTPPTITGETKALVRNSSTGQVSEQVIATASITDASETVAGKVSVGTQTFGGNKTIVGESATVGNAFTVQNLSYTEAFTVSNEGDSYANGVRIGRGKANVPSNLVFGNSALNANTTGISNTAIATNALNRNTTGLRNTAIGSAAMYLNVSGSRNTAIGVEALRKNTSNDNVAIGDVALFENTSGNSNVAVGNYALTNNTTGTANTSIGHAALIINSTGVDNTGVGRAALGACSSGSGNTALGRYAGLFLADGVTGNVTANSSVFIGENSKSSATNQTNQIVIGSGAIGLGSNTATLGNTSITKTVLRGVIAHSTSYTVATLPTGALGDTAFVTDAVAPTYLGALTGGGSVACPVFHNGTNWVSH